MNMINNSGDEAAGFRRPSPLGPVGGTAVLIRCVRIVCTDSTVCERLFQVRWMRREM